MRKRHSPQQIAQALRQAEAGTPMAEIIRKLGAQCRTARIRQGLPIAGNMGPGSDIARSPSLELALDSASGRIPVGSSAQKRLQILVDAEWYRLPADSVSDITAIRGP